MAFAPAGRGHGANEKVCGSEVWSSGGVLSSLTFQAQLASGISQKKCRGRGRKTLHQPTHPLTHPAFSDSLFPLGLGLDQSSNPCPQGPILPPTEGRWEGGGGVGETLGGLRGCEVCGAHLGGEGSFFPLLYEKSTSVPSSGLGVENGAVSFQPTVSPDPKPTNPALSGTGMGIVSIRPEAAAVPAPALRNRHQGSGQFWEEALVNRLSRLQCK